MKRGGAFRANRESSDDDRARRLDGEFSVDEVVPCRQGQAESVIRDVLGPQAQAADEPVQLVQLAEQGLTSAPAVMENLLASSTLAT